VAGLGRDIKRAGTLIRLQHQVLGLAAALHIHPIGAPELTRSERHAADQNGGYLAG
jgi:hypothetical protein